MSENSKFRGNYKGTRSMNAENQSMEFVNDHLENAKNVTSVNIMQDDINEGNEEEPLSYDAE